jgi:hypothetical protein
MFGGIKQSRPRTALSLLQPAREFRRKAQGRAVHNLPGEFAFGSLAVAVEYQIGAVLGAIRRCAERTPMSPADLVEMNALILNGLGVPSEVAAGYAARAVKILEDDAPGRLAWWNARPARAPAKRALSTKV